MFVQEVCHTTVRIVVIDLSIQFSVLNLVVVGLFVSVQCLMRLSRCRRDTEETLMPDVELNLIEA